ncbi:hypothetical protein ESCO_006627 [Escovopsis weberi]|uniref:Autophagy-related protein 28 n=1 Tax=Escovopsis weberi TaxID=150374 RepID=A0A0M9VXN6_ESCWE|nr:hypothetical protein ESCO_006627 [Escovopsis weberi]
MDRLSPRPEDASSGPSDDLPRAWIDEHDDDYLEAASSRRSPPPPSRRGKHRLSGSPSLEKKPWTMFSGPPPPISASMVIRKNNGRRAQSESLGRDRNALQSPVRGIAPLVGSVLFEARPETGVNPRPDSRWRGFRRQERALEQEVQQLLDYQAAALVSGSGGGGGGGGDAMAADADVRSDGSITPTGTLYSTQSSRHCMTGSLYVPTRATANGNVIPVRQPTKARPLGLRATRAGLHKSIMAMARLKQEESAYLEAALAQRKDALEYLGNLGTRKADIDAELRGLDQGHEEPLAQELRELAEKQGTLDREIQRLEETLAAMRSRRRWLGDRMDSIRNKREAGLSGYRGALKEVDAEVAALMRRPPVQPLDPDILNLPGPAGPRDEAPASSGGAEFMQLHPERRTLEMARSWWEHEAAALETRRLRADADRQALEEGGVVWDLVMHLVSDFESSLRQVMQLPAAAAATAPSSSSFSPSSSPPPLPAPSSSTLIKKTKEKMPSQEETIRNQLPQMRNVLEELERHISLAQEKRWNLLICAIGAESEAFREAYDMLEAFVGLSEGGPGQPGASPPAAPGSRAAEAEAEADETDSEVPQDLLGAPPSDSSRERSVPLPRSGSESENEVPLEFLAEHVPQ